MKDNIIAFNGGTKIHKLSEMFINYIETNLRSGVLKTPENVNRYEGQKTPVFFNEFSSIVCYVASLNKAVVMDDYSHLPHAIEKDLKLATKKGEVSLYLSLVFNALVRDLFPHISCNLVQGFYTYTSKDQTTYSSNTENTGFHAFSVIGEKVIDCCFFSVDPNYKTPAPAIIGLVPEDVEFYGWEEGASLEEHYIEEYALTNYDGILDWLVTHLDLQRDFLIASII